MQPGFSFEPLTPTAFLRRAAQVFPDRIGVVDGNLKFTYGEFLDRALKFAGALQALGVEPGDRVAVLRNDLKGAQAAA
jgi:fatty-acyl-CoA synthase